MTTRKIDALVGTTAAPFEYGNTFERQVVGRQTRLTIGFDDAHDRCVLALAERLTAPFQLLLVLHTTRTGASLGRYESPELSLQQVRAFLYRFGPFLSQDARHDFWLRSHGDDATIVLDRHNIIYAYGPLPAFEAALERIGGHRLGLPSLPDPHVHYYHRAWDEAEREILAAVPWTRKPLNRSDVQCNADEQAG